MAYTFNQTPTNVKSVSSTGLVSRTDRWAGKTTAGINDCFWVDGYQLEHQRMNDDTLYALLLELRTAINAGQSPTLTLCLAIGDQERFRPRIGLTGGNTWYRYEILDQDDPVFGNSTQRVQTRTPIEETGPNSASQFVGDWDEIAKADLHSQFSYTETIDSVEATTRVLSYAYSASDTRDIYNKAVASEYGKVKLWLFLGSGAEQAGDDNVSHPMNFRPVQDLKVDNADGSTTASYWDFSQPCPPNCGSGN